MRILIWVVLFFGISVAEAKVRINGEFQESGDFRYVAAYVPSTYKKLKFDFPRDHYEAGYVIMSSLQYDKTTPVNERNINLKDYVNVISLGSLDIVSFNKKSGAYKFKFSLDPGVINHSDSMVKAFPSYFVKGKVFFSNNKEYCYVEGKLSYVKNKPYLINLPKKSNCKVSLRFIEGENFEGMMLKITEAFPATFELSKISFNYNDIT